MTDQTMCPLLSGVGEYEKLVRFPCQMNACKFWGCRRGSGKCTPGWMGIDHIACAPGNDQCDGDCRLLTRSK